MKNLKYLFGILVFGLMVFSSCKKENNIVIPTNNDSTSEYPDTIAAVAGKLVLVCKFDGDVCNDIVVAGSYNSWSTDTANLVRFQPVSGWDGWYKAVIDTVNGTYGNDKTPIVSQFKPVQLDNDGLFESTWKYQVGDSASVTVWGGNVDVTGGYSGECNLYALSADEPIFLEFASWKGGNSPCVAIPTHDYTFTVVVPDTTASLNMDVSIVGGFTNYGSWNVDTTALVMAKQDDGTYTITLKDQEEGTAYKYTINHSWDYNELGPTSSVVNDSIFAPSVDNRTTGTSEAIRDTVYNWKGITAYQK